METGEKLFILRLKNGEDSAWHDLFAKHYSVMCYLAKQYLHDNYLAESTVQGVLSHMWDVRSTIEISDSLRGYLLRATRNKCLDYLRSSKTVTERPFSSFPDCENFIKLSSPENNNPLGVIVGKELENDLRRAINDMPEKTREVFKKSRMEGKKYEEIANETGISLNTVKYHMKQAMAILKDRFGKYLPLALIILMLGLWR